MVYKEIPVDLIDGNPWQTRKKYDKDALASLMTSASDKLGIRQVPLVRPHGKKYQIAYGHGRVQAWKALGKKTIMCRVEELTDRVMKKELLIENTNRSDLNEDERFQAIEQCRLDPDTDDPQIRNMLKKQERGWIAELSRLTGVAEPRLSEIYDVHSMRQMLPRKFSEEFSEEPTADIIRATAGLGSPNEKEEQVKLERAKLVEKAQNMGWDRDTTRKVKTALKDMTPETRTQILKKETRLPPEVIVATGEIKDAEKQKAAIDYIETHKLDEDLSLKLIDRVKTGEPLVAEVKEINEAGEVLDEMSRVYQIVCGWGVNQRMILSKENKWTQALQLTAKIKSRITEFEESKYAQNK